MTDENSSWEDSWQSPSEADNSTDDPTYEDPGTVRARKKQLQKNLRRAQENRGSGRRRNAGRAPRLSGTHSPSAAAPGPSNVPQGSPSSSGSDESKSKETVVETDEDGDVAERIEKLSGRKRRAPIKTTFLSELEPEPFALGIMPLPDDFGWCEDIPGERTDCFAPYNPPGSVYNGDEEMIKIFLDLYEPALELLMRSINETGRELVSAKKMKSFKKVTWPELLRFHSVLIYCQSVKISRWEMYWRKNSPLYQVFVAEQMTYRRFKQIKRCVRCYVPSENKAQGLDDPSSSNFDPLHKITPIQNVLLQSFRKFRFPPREITVDEQMVKYKVKTIFQLWVGYVRDLC